MMYQIPSSASSMSFTHTPPFSNASSPPSSSSTITFATYGGFSTTTASMLQHRTASRFPFSATRNRPRAAVAAIRAKAGADFYSTLNVSSSATLQEIKSSYRKLARKYHPDMNKSPGAEDKFKEISAAYEMMRKDLYMIALVSQVYKERMKGQQVHLGLILLIYSRHSLVVQMDYLEIVMKGASTSI